jgi:electron transport complex protein RnfD
MLDVVIALIPAAICSFVFYGWREVLLMAVSVASCVLLEWAITKFMLKKPSTIGDFSAVITGILLALNLPYTTPLWVVVIGAIVAIGVAKLTFGGIGQNIWNPALVGRVFLLVSFPTYMTTWGAPQGVVDAMSGPTPLGAIQEGLMQGATVQDIMAEHGYSYSQMLFANLGGSAGEVCALALLAGFVYLCIRRVIKPWITLSIFATVALTALIFWGINPDRFTDPLFNLLSGGLILGACFMATDYVTSPMSLWGGVIFGVGIGFLTMMIRYFGSYPEGVSFAILIMNSVVPLLNMWFHQKKFGRK